MHVNVIPLSSTYIIHTLFLSLSFSHSHSLTLSLSLSRARTLSLSLSRIGAVSRQHALQRANPEIVKVYETMPTGKLVCVLPAVCFMGLKVICVLPTVCITGEAYGSSP